MGMFDSVYVDCPKCGTDIEFQSKAGDCILGTYNLNNAPQEILEDIEGDVEECHKCGETVKILFEASTKAVAKQNW